MADSVGSNLVKDQIVELRASTLFNSASQVDSLGEGTLVHVMEAELA